MSPLRRRIMAMQDGRIKWKKVFRALVRAQINPLILGDMTLYQIRVLETNDEDDDAAEGTFHFSSVEEYQTAKAKGVLAKKREGILAWLRSLLGV